jgi:uncharacterized protein with PQ loop repeat
MHTHPALHHLHKRKRIHLKKEKYPSPDRFKRFIDNVILFIAVVGPLITLPQVLKIWINNHAEGVSILSWAGYSFSSMLWFTYGILHKEKPLIIAGGAGFIVNLLVLIGAVVY